MITLLLWLCPFTWPIAIYRMMMKRQNEAADRIIYNVTGKRPPKRRGPLGWLLHKAWTTLRPPAEAA